MKKKDHPLHKSLEDLLVIAGKKFKVGFEPVRMDGEELLIPQISDMPRYIEKMVAKAGKNTLKLPLWAKIWPASVMLGIFAGKTAGAGEARALEIGCGLGVAGLLAAKSGMRVTLSDPDPDALLFARIGALKNGLGDEVSMLRLDPARDGLDEKFDLIMGCDVLDAPQRHEGILSFLRQHLSDAPGAEVVLGVGHSRGASKAFFDKASDDFKIAMKHFDYGGKDKSKIAIARMRNK